MKDKLTGSDYPRPNTSELISEISGINRRISEIYSLRDSLPGRFLPRKEFDRIRQLHQLKDQKTIDLLMLNNQNRDDRIQIVLQIFKGEKLHPFSMNKVSIYIPSDQDSNRDYYIKINLSDLRRSGVSDDSLQAKKLLGEISESADTIVNYTHRTVFELKRIGNLTRNIVSGETRSKFSAEELENLSSMLISERLCKLKANGQLPQDSSLSFFLVKDYAGRVIGENTQFSLSGHSFDFPLSGQRLEGIVEKLGGYDKIITLNR